jgi:hypothetical protein
MRQLDQTLGKGERAMAACWMSRTVVSFGLAGLVIVGVAANGALAQDAVRCVNVTPVDSRYSSCPTIQDPTIQIAVNNANPGDMIFVGMGVYDEQVKIPTPLTLEGAGAAVTTIMPSTVTANSSSLFSGAPIAAIIVVDGTTDVAVTDLTVDGTVAATFLGCSPTYVGIFYRASAGVITHTHVTHIWNPVNSGCQGYLGVFVQSGNGGPGLNSSVAILDNTVDFYGKNGITANEPGTFVTVAHNTVMGRGHTTYGDAAQNGVQIGFGAHGFVSDNTITNHYYDPPEYVACGVLFFHAGGGLGRTKTNTYAGNEQNTCTAGVGPSQNSPFN